MAQNPHGSPKVTNGVMQPYSGGDTFGVEETSDNSSNIPAPNEPLTRQSLPPLEVLEVDANFPDAPVFTPRQGELVIAPTSGMKPLEVLAPSQGPKLATPIEMQAFIDKVRSLRAAAPLEPKAIIAVLLSGFDIYNRTERTRLAAELVSPAVKAEAIYELALRTSSSLKAFYEVADKIFVKPAAEVANTFMQHVRFLLAERNVSIKSSYVSSSLAAVLEEAYYAMILDSTQLSSQDAQRRFGKKDIVEDDSPPDQPAAKLTPEQKRLKMGFKKKEDLQAVEKGEASVAEPDEAEQKQEADPVSEYGEELGEAARTEFDSLIERIKPADAKGKFARYGKLKPINLPAAKRGSGLMDAYAAMSGEAPNFSSSQQALVYEAAQALSVWCRSEIELLIQRGRDLDSGQHLVDLSKTLERTDGYKTKFSTLDQAEKKNSAAVRAKLVEASKLALANAQVMDLLESNLNLRREMALLTGEGSGKILHDVKGISADVWRENSKAREQREQDARRQQELLRHDPGAEPDRRNLI